MNKVILHGRLTRDVEHRTTQSGRSVVRAGLAVNRPAAKDGQQQADFINLVAWEKTAELFQRYLHKGSEVLIEGRLSVRSYEDQQGQKRTATEVIVERMEFCGKAEKPSGNSSYDGDWYGTPTDEDVLF